MRRAMQPQEAASPNRPLDEEPQPEEVAAVPATRAERPGRHELITQAWLRSLGVPPRGGPRDDPPV